MPSTQWISCFHWVLKLLESPVKMKRAQQTADGEGLAVKAGTVLHLEAKLHCRLAWGLPLRRVLIDYLWPLQHLNKNRKLRRLLLSCSYSTYLLQEGPHKEDSANEGNTVEASKDEPLAYYGQRSRKKVQVDECPAGYIYVELD
uniref:Uncharacterized protein n=1 Tax=Aegilops tauschii TaxID=37682 RepID=M8BLF8_AEGTA